MPNDYDEVALAAVKRKRSDYDEAALSVRPARKGDVASATAMASAALGNPLDLVVQAAKKVPAAKKTTPSRRIIDTINMFPHGGTVNQGSVKSPSRPLDDYERDAALEDYALRQGNPKQNREKLRKQWIKEHGFDPATDPIRALKEDVSDTANYVAETVHPVTRFVDQLLNTLTGDQFSQQEGDPADPNYKEKPGTTAHLVGGIASFPHDIANDAAILVHPKASIGDRAGAIANLVVKLVAPEEIVAKGAGPVANVIKTLRAGGVKERQLADSIEQAIQSGVNPTEINNLVRERVKLSKSAPSAQPGYSDYWGKPPTKDMRRAIDVTDETNARSALPQKAGPTGNPHAGPLSGEMTPVKLDEAEKQYVFSNWRQATEHLLGSVEQEIQTRKGAGRTLGPVKRQLQESLEAGTPHPTVEQELKDKFRSQYGEPPKAVPKTKSRPPSEPVEPRPGTREYAVRQMTGEPSFTENLIQGSTRRRLSEVQGEANATQTGIKQENVRGQSEGTSSVGKAKETGASNSVSGAAEGQGITHEDVDELRKDMGWKPREGQEKPDTQLIKDATKHQGQESAIAEQVMSDPKKTLSDEQTIALGSRLRKLKNDIAEARKAKDTDAFDLADAEAQKIADALDESGSRQGRDFRARQFLFEDNVDPWIAERRIERGGGKVDDKLRAEFEDLHAQHEETKAKLATVEQQLAEERARQATAAENKRAPRFDRKDLDAELDDLFKQFQKSSAKLSAGLDPEVLHVVGKIAVNYMKRGVNTLEDVYKAVLQHIPGLSYDDMVAGIDQATKGVRQTKTELQEQISSLKRQAKSDVKVREKIASLQEQLDTGNYLEPSKRERVISKRLEDLQAHKEFLRRQVEARIKDATTPMGTKIFKEATGAVRGAVLGTDFGVMTRQGLFSLVSHPVVSAKALAKAAKALFSEENLIKTELEIKNRRIDGVRAEPIRNRAGLSITDSMTHPEELIVGRFLKRIPVAGKLFGKPLERAQIAFINTIRADLFDAGIVKGWTERELETRAKFINSVTGRGNVKQVPELLSAIMTSPRYEISRWETLAAPLKNLGTVGLDLATGKGWNRAALTNIKDMGVTAASVYGVFKAAELAGYTVDWDPRSGDFMKMRRGNEVWDISAGIAPRLRDILRAYIAYDDPKYNKNLGDIIRGVAVRTVNPAIRMPVTQASIKHQEAEGKTVGGKGDKAVNDPFSGFPIGEYDEGFQTALPLIFQSIRQALEQEGLGAAVSTGVKEFVGTGVNRYPASKKKKER